MRSATKDIFTEIATLEIEELSLKTVKSVIPDLPRLDLNYIKSLTNPVGILQHATYTVPNYHHGYCLDDNARALMLAGMDYYIQPTPETRNLMKTYLAYIHYMQKENGQFRNFLSFDHRFLDESGTEDSYGRTIWALGNFIKLHPEDSFTSLAREMLHRAIPHSEFLRSNRAIAYTLLGLIDYCKCIDCIDSDIILYLRNLANFLKEEYQACHKENWSWYENIVAYDNAIIPLSLLRAADLLDNDEMRKIAGLSSGFLDKITFVDHYFSPIGNEGWYRYNGHRSTFGQQPIEVPSTVLLYKQLYAQTADPFYLQRAIDTFQWFFGKNDLGIPLYDPQSKGCSDGLDSHGANENQGAESAISFWQTYFYICHDLN